MKNKILELRKQGLSINEIVKQLNCAKSTISYHLNNAGLGGVRHKFLNGISDETLNSIKKYRLELKTYDEILMLVDISRDKLIKICRLYNINVSSTTFRVKDLDGVDVLKYYLTVNSLRKTAKYFNVSRETIRKYIPDDIIDGNKCNKITITRTQSVINWRKRKKIELINYKGGCCEKCGYNKSITALQFHHRDPKEKDFGIGGKSYSIDRLKKEVDKCILVCANCHAEIHDEIK